MSNILFVAGDFNEQGGRSSGFMARLRAELKGEVTFHNGGTLEDLQHLTTIAHQYSAVWWMPNVSNEVPKFVRTLKDMCPRSVLVISKNNRVDKYTTIDLVARMFQSRANLMLEIRGETPPFTANVFDPLGNFWCKDAKDIAVMARVLEDRTNQLKSYTRMGSKSVGDTLRVPKSYEVGEFIDIVRGYADRFHELVHAANPGRFLGNASFRCTKAGFPAFRDNNLIYLSRRNLDKRELATDGFVAVDTLLSTDHIAYFGDRKPSVDTPIQLKLFQALPWVKYMLHAHVYIKRAEMTGSHVPCGALEEVDEVLKVASRQNHDGYLAVNLLGHGCLVLASNPSQLRDLDFIARPMPEIVYGT